MIRYPIALIVILTSCREELSLPSSENRSDRVEAEVTYKRPSIRWIRTYGTKNGFGIELNGDRAFLREDGFSGARTEIPREEGDILFNDFYRIKNLEGYSDSKVENPRTATYVWIQVFDERPQYYSEEWVGYGLPMSELDENTSFADWFRRFKALKNRTISEQGSAPNPLHAE